MNTSQNIYSLTLNPVHESSQKEKRSRKQNTIVSKTEKIEAEIRLQPFQETEKKCLSYLF